MKPHIMLKYMHWYPPYWATGIRVKNVSNDLMSLDVHMKLTIFNKNYVCTHFGGSLYSMTDPFYMLMLLNVLGRDFVVWDLEANIKYIKPGRGKVTALFILSQDEIQEIQEATKSNKKYIFNKMIEVKDDEQNIVSLVEKKLYIRRK